MDGLPPDKLTSPSFFDTVLASQRVELDRGDVEIDALRQKISFNFDRLDKKKACNNRPNYYIIILFLGLISVSND